MSNKYEQVVELCYLYSGLKDYNTDANNAILVRVEEIAKQKGATMAQIALAWVTQKGGASFRSSGFFSVI